MSPDPRVKALSLVAPGGALIALGRKTLEIRRWAPDLRPDEDLLVVENRRFLHEDGEEDPDGRACALVRVSTIRPFTAEGIPAACATSWQPGWLAWHLTDIRPCRPPTPLPARRRIYELCLPDLQIFP